MLHESYSARRELEYASHCPHSAYAYIWVTMCKPKRSSATRVDRDLANSCLVLSMPSSILGLYVPVRYVMVCTFAYTAGNSWANLVILIPLSGMATPPEGK